ncbi:MAG: SRPBCC domain-containing protein [Alphaproteobacteria bacterium]|nr:SRPBCC domain-containing protein [Alphaproteobacteria bacterium]
MAAVRQQITVDAPARTVWNALTTEAGLVSWWAEEARVDPREGGRIVVVRTVDEARVEDRGLFVSLRPTRHIEISWDSPGGSGWRGSRVEIQVGRAGDETKVHVVQSGGDVVGDAAAREALEAMWKAALLRLRAVIEGD